jgi:hypothetical protein
MEDPVVQVINEKDSEVVYTLRIKGNTIRPKVFEDGTYTVRVGEPGTERMKDLAGLKSRGESSAEVIEVKF